MNMLKKFLVLTLFCALALSLHSCNNDDDDGTRYYLEALEVVAADLPTSFVRGGTYRIYVDMRLPSNCHFFEGFDFQQTGDTMTERTIYPIAAVLDRTDCQEYDARNTDAYFNFQVLFTGTYVFKFYAGQDENGEEQFLIYEVPVARSN